MEANNVNCLSRRASSNFAQLEKTCPSRHKKNKLRNHLTCNREAIKPAECRRTALASTGLRRKKKEETAIAKKHLACKREEIQLYEGLQICF